MTARGAIGPSGSTVDDVPVDLEEPAKRRVERGDPTEPLHRRHPVAAGNEQPDRRAVVRRQRCPFISTTRNAPPASRDRQRPLERHLAADRADEPVVRTGEEEFDRRRKRPGLREDSAQRQARPFGRAHRAERPLLAGGGRVEEAAAVAGALERDRLRPRRPGRRSSTGSPSAAQRSRRSAGRRRVRAPRNGFGRSGGRRA